MQAPKRRRVSPALAISIVALVLAIAGTPVAGASVRFVAKALGLTSTQKKQVTKIADQQIKKEAGGLSVRSAKSAKTATTAASATNATNATNANHATTATTADGLSSTAASAFYSSGNVFGTGLKTFTNTGTTATPQNVEKMGPFTITATCTLASGTIDETVTLAYPANAVINDSLAKTAGTLTLDDANAADPSFGPDSSADGEWQNVPATLIPAGGPAYQLLEGWDAVDYPSAGDCAVQLFGVQG